MLSSFDKNYMTDRRKEMSRSVHIERPTAAENTNLSEIFKGLVTKVAEEQKT